MTDPDEAALLAAIIAAPADDTPRLVYADWLQEQAADATCGECDAGRVFGRDVQSLRPAGAWHTCRRCGGSGRLSDGRAGRAEFIRVQCELAALNDRHRRGDATPADAERLEALRRREGQLTMTVYPREIWPTFDWLRGLGINPDACTLDSRGGWIAAVTCDAAVWIAHGDAIRARHPVTAVRLTTAPEVGWVPPAHGRDGYFAFARDPAARRITWAEYRAGCAAHAPPGEPDPSASEYNPDVGVLLACRFGGGVAFEVPPG
ncbi:TIGR02996 domain-containing protein [Gemmata sp. JC673]|uniref:TIGR02996 domain-containing protein n=1 Tax=Gemmata algarum TaxID=2975278 RepID=A0ABU5ESB5_9BACT|nr:TIGR02996 domain-containing protein [Gemmata algarum]MDY3558247.1 TIGR02996 domain-containing protein [Gemmata algarum]